MTILVAKKVEVITKINIIKNLIKRRMKIKMAYTITDKCIKCGACISACPVEAISMKDGKVVIDPKKCISCGTCFAVCPVGAPQAK